MKKRVVALAIIGLLPLVACSGNNSEQATVNNAADSVSQDAAVYESTVEPTQTEVVEETSLYERFLSNEAKVRISQNNNFGYYCNLEDMQDQEFTLEELTNRIIAGYVGDEYSGVKISLESIEYSYIDCGNDGKKELAVRINTPSIDGWEEYIVIRENNGALETIFSDVAWSRSRICLNKYGYFYNDGSGGAANHAFDKSFIDAEGHFHYIYTASSTVFAIGEDYTADLWFGNDIHSIPAGIDVDGEYVFLSFDFNNTMEDEADDVYTYAKTELGDGFEPGDGFRGYFYGNLVDDDSIYEDTYPLKQFYEKEGLKTYTTKEIDQMIADKEIKEGLTEDVKNGEQVDWEPIEITFEPYIATYNDYNFLGIKEFFPLGFSFCGETQTGSSAYLTLEANGEFSSRYHYSDYEMNPDYISYENECIGKFEVESKISDHSYKLKVTYFALVNEPGKQETMDGALGSKIIKNYVEIPGFDDGGTEYLLYAPGTELSELGEEITGLFPDCYLEEKTHNGILQTYVLVETDGNNYVWRCSGY